MHMGHLIPFMFTACVLTLFHEMSMLTCRSWLQRVFDVPLVIQITGMTLVRTVFVADQTRRREIPPRARREEAG